MKIQYINACKFLRINKYSSFLVFGFFNYIINFPEIQIIYLLSKTNCFLSHCSPLEWISLDLISCTQQLMQMDIWKTAQVRACGWLQHVRHLLSGRGKRLSNSYVTALMKFFLIVLFCDIHKQISRAIQTKISTFISSFFYYCDEPSPLSLFFSWNNRKWEVTWVILKIELVNHIN